jgi:methanethiol oxidase
VARKVITIPAVRAGDAEPPPLLADSRAIPPLVSHVALSPDDRSLYVSCWGTGELRQYDVCDPFHPVLMGLVRLGGIARKQPHPRHPRRLLRGGPRMVQVSDDGRRLYVISALHSAWDRQFHRGGADGWLARCLADPNGGLSVDPGLFVDFGDDRPQYLLLDECLQHHPGDEARQAALSRAVS